MATLRKWFEGFTEDMGEIPTHIVFGSDWRGKWPAKFTDAMADVVSDEVLPFAEVPAAIWDVEFDDGYGGVESPGLCAWSKSWVIMSGQYDGCEWIEWVPRHPTPHAPVRVGG